MPIVGGFFNARIVNGQYDRTYLAEDFAECMKGLVKNGIVKKYGSYAEPFKVTAGEAGTMNLNIAPGRAWVEGLWVDNTANLVIEAPAFHPTEQRVCAVVLRLDYVQRKFLIYVKEGTLGNPSTIDFQRDSEAYELFLALYRTKPTYTDITDVSISDVRHMSAYCGISRMAVDAIDGSNVMTDITLEEYEGLSEAEKMNGNEYFITDKKIIFRNGIDYSASGGAPAGSASQVINGLAINIAGSVSWEE